MQRVKPYLIVLVLGWWVIASPTFAAQKSVLISEVQTGSADSASDEFVELYNKSDQAVDVSGWSLYYKSSTGKTWSKKATIAESSSLASNGFWLFSSVIVGNTHFVSGFSESGGNLQLRNKLGEVQEQFAWGAGDGALGQPAAMALGGQSMYRLYDEATHQMVNTDNNFSDFDITNNPSPNTVPVTDILEPDPNPLTFPLLKLTELFPDPVSPQSDNYDEFIEVYNPGSTVVNLDGWKLRDDSGKEFIIKAKAVASQGFVALNITETGITLNNTGDTITLINPNGDEVDQSADYADAKPGLSWSLINNEWGWATAPTPGLVNAAVFVEPDDFSPAAAVAKVKQTAAKKPAATKSTSAKTAAPKTSKTAATKSANNPNSKVSDQAQGQVSGSNWWTWLLIALGVGTIGYGIYEYRSEIQLFFKKLGAKLGIGSKAS